MQELQQNTAEWVEFRRTKIGASDAPVIMGVSPWKTPYQLWEEKVGIREDQKINDSMRRGNELEEVARKRFEEQTGLIMFSRISFHPYHKWMMASLDGMDLEGKNMVEIKCPGDSDHKIALAGLVPEKYYPQIQHQLEVTGLDKSFYYSFDGNEGVIVEVMRDQEYIDQMIKKEMDFYCSIQSLDPPAMCSKDYEGRDDDVWNVISNQWIQCNREIQELREKEEELRKTLIKLSGNKNIQGGGIKLCKTIRKGSIDYKSIPEFYNLDLETYRKPPIEFWKFTEC